MKHVLVWASAVIAGCASPATIAPAPLLPFDGFFAGASNDAPRLSPDGRWIAWIAPVDRAPNLHVAPSDEPSARRALTTHDGRGVQSRDVSGNVLWRWTRDSARLVYPVDRDGDERRELRAVDVATGASRSLLGADETAQVRLVQLSEAEPHLALVETDERAPGAPDLWRVDLVTGARELALENPGVVGFLADASLRPRVASVVSAGPRLTILRPEGDGWSGLAVFESEDLPALFSSIYQGVARVDAAGETLYLYDSRGRNTAALAALDLASGAIRVVAEHPELDLCGVLFDADGHPQAVCTEFERRRWQALDGVLEEDLGWLEGHFAGDVEIVSRDTRNRRWIVRETRADAPTSWHLVERAERASERLFVSTPELEGLPFADLHPFVVTSRDGLSLVAYLALPTWTDPDGDGRPDAPQPAVMIVHGGPDDERASYAYSPFVQWLTNRGYAVIYPNYRGSPGFGKAFSNGQNHEWGRAMNLDLVDVVAHLVEEGVVDPARVGILGGSYGGYAVLVAMTSTPGVFRCGVDLVGPSDLEGSLPHWNPDLVTRRFGDPRTPEGRAELRDRSPVHRADQARHPVLIGQGDRDSRVPTAQSDAMVEALQAAGAPVVYLFFPDEGHGFVRRENVRAFWAVVERFLAQELDGRTTPFADELEGSSVEVRAGAERVPGLSSALGAQRLR